MFAVVGLLLIALQSQPTAIVTHCDVIELNHVYDEDAKHVFSQWIFWEWRGEESEHRVIAWRLARRGTIERYQSGWRVKWFENGVMRDVRATFMRESWTSEDPEIIDRTWLPITERKELGNRP